ncbi:MAG: hypothetical protein WCP32_05550 [Bacteroidota bacterium]
MKLTNSCGYTKSSASNLFFKTSLPLPGSLNQNNEPGVFYIVKN